MLSRGCYLAKKLETLLQGEVPSRVNTGFIIGIEPGEISARQLEKRECNGKDNKIAAELLRQGKSSVID